MKKLIYLFLTVLIVACSSDDSSDDSNQLFLEKYDSVVWEKSPLDNSYRIAFINSSNTLTEYSSSFGANMEEICASFPLEGTYTNLNNIIITSSIQEENENSLSLLWQLAGTPAISALIVYTVTSDGSTYTLTIQFVSEDEEVIETIYNRTDYSVCF